MEQINETSLKIFTLNVWGLKWVSDDREERIQSISNHLSENDYDVVFLQELWVESDFQYIKEKTKLKYKFGHMFKNASILGTSGLVVLVKWVPKVFHFQPFSVNGSPFRPLHGDWFTSKGQSNTFYKKKSGICLLGIGYVRIEFDSLNLHLFCTHMHAQYNVDERLSDQYSVHRICQSYEISKFLELMTDSHSKTSTVKDFVILVGDMNASSRELPYRLLVSLTQLNDCFKVMINSNKQNDCVEGGDVFNKRIQELTNEDYDSDMTDDEYHTCGHRENIYTPKTEPSKRIDFILFRLFDSTNNSTNYPMKEFLIKKLCEVKYQTIQCKDQSGRPFSDHQPVVAIFKIKCSDQKTISKRMETSNDELKRESSPEKVIFKNESNSGNQRENCLISRVTKGDGSSHKQLHGFNNDSLHISNKLENIGLSSAKSKPKLKLNIPSEVTESTSKTRLQKHLASNSVYPELKILSPNRQQYLEITKNLLEDYVKDNVFDILFGSVKRSIVFSLIIFTLIIFIISSFVYSLCLFTSMTKFGISLSTTLVVILFFIVYFLKILSSRNEENAIKAILNDIEKELLLSHRFNS